MNIDSPIQGPVGCGELPGILAEKNNHHWRWTKFFLHRVLLNMINYLISIFVFRFDKDKILQYTLTENQRNNLKLLIILKYT